MDIGKKIKQFRLQKKMTQSELADRCNLTKGYISQIENNLSSPSINTLISLLACLGSDLTDFFSDTAKVNPVVYKCEDATSSTSEDGSYEIEWLVPQSATLKMEPIKLKLQPGSTGLNHLAHEGEEYGYILKGKVKLELGKRIHRLKKGDSFYYKAHDDHSFANPYTSDAVILWIGTPPNF